MWWLGRRRSSTVVWLPAANQVSHEVSWHEYERAEEDRVRALERARACDAELAALSTQYPPVGTTPSGQRMTSPFPASFATWFSTVHDKISDRDELARDRQRRAEIPAAPSRRTGSSAYHTDPNVHVDVSGYGSPSF